jgi:methionyl-tRNA synthetase
VWVAVVDAGGLWTPAVQIAASSVMLCGMDIKPTITYEDFAKLDLRIATIEAAEIHPNADRLLKLQIDLGGEKRQVCAGIRAYYDPATLVGKQVVVVANLAPRTIRGEISNGMVLAASNTVENEIRDVAVLAPIRAVPPGAVVS